MSESREQAQEENGNVLANSSTSEGKNAELRLRPIEILARGISDWRLIAGIPLGIAAVVAIVSLLIPPRYTASTTFVPETRGELPQAGNLMAFASQLGIGSFGGGESPFFYRSVLESRSIQTILLRTRFPDYSTPEIEDSVMLLDALQIQGDAMAERLEDGRKELAELTRITVDRETNVVAVSVETKYRELSASVANHYLNILEQFNLETRQNIAGEQRRFVEERLEQAKTELGEAENALEVFLGENRVFSDSPQLQFVHDRLQRDVAMKQEILTSLTREYEQARIEEVNDTPLFTVIDIATAPQKKSFPRRTLNVLLAFIFGSFLAITLIPVRMYLSHLRTSDPSYSELVSSWHETLGEMKRLIGRQH